MIYTPTEEEKEVLLKTGNAGDKLPATVVAVWGEGDEPLINAKVTTDGPGEQIWKTSIKKGDGPGEWNWPVIEKH